MPKKYIIVGISKIWSLDVMNKSSNDCLKNTYFCQILFCVRNIFFSIIYLRYQPKWSKKQFHMIWVARSVCFICEASKFKYKSKINGKKIYTLFWQKRLLCPATHGKQNKHKNQIKCSFVLPTYFAKRSQGYIFMKTFFKT